MDEETRDLIDRLVAQGRARRQPGKYVVWVDDWASLLPREQKLINAARRQRSYTRGAGSTRALREMESRRRAEERIQAIRRNRDERKYGAHTRVSIPETERWRKAAYWEARRETKQPGFVWAKTARAVGWLAGIVVAVQTASIGWALVAGLVAWGAGRLIADLVVYWPYRLRVKRRASELLVVFEESRTRSRNISANLRQEVLERDDHKCQHCGTEDDLHIDHIHPHSRGGLTRLDNLQVLCASCNIRKGTRPDAEARRTINSDPELPLF